MATKPTPLDKQVSSGVESTLVGRGKTHGNFLENSAVSQQLKRVLRNYASYHELPVHQQESLDMICHKIARIIAGDSDFADHWHDIAGYATLSEKECSR